MRIVTKMESKGRVLRPDGAFMVFPCIGSQTQVTTCPACLTAFINGESFTLMFSAPILVMIVILPGLFSGFKMSMSFTNSFGSILSLTFQNKKTFVSIIPTTPELDQIHVICKSGTLIPRGFAIPLRNSTCAPSN